LFQANRHSAGEGSTTKTSASFYDAKRRNIPEDCRLYQRLL
jgi:hypothetical protein